MLPFFLLAIGLVFAWTKRLFGPTSGLLAVLLFTTLPPVLAHAGLASTDMALTATLVAALLAFVYWLERSTLSRSVVLGIAVASVIPRAPRHSRRWLSMDNFLETSGRESKLL